MALDYGAGHYFAFLNSPSSCIEHIPLPVTKVKLKGELCNNRRRAAQRRPPLPIHLCPLCCTNTIGAMIYSLLIGKVQQIKKICVNSLFVLQICPASPKGAVSTPRFTHKHGEKRSSYKIGCCIYIVPVLLALKRLFRFPYYARTRL
jgi:hypothetical protein